MACPDMPGKPAVQLRLARQPGRKSAAEIVPAWQVIEGESVPGGPIAFTAVIARREKRSLTPFNATCSTSRLHSSCEPTARDAIQPGAGTAPLSRRPVVSASGWSATGLVRKQLLELQKRTAR